MGRPVLEPTELYKKKRARNRRSAFQFHRKGEREVAMRPELTPTLARVVAAHEREFKKPLKWFSIGQCFRYEKQQRGRLREHFQLNCDIIGEATRSPRMSNWSRCASTCCERLDSRKRISSSGSATANSGPIFCANKDVPEERWEEMLQAIDKIEREPREKTAARLGALAEPVFEVLDSGGRSEKLDRLVGGLRAARLGRDS